jgi:hypothetical protein
MITRVRQETEGQKQERELRQWAEEVNAARLANRSSSRIVELEQKLDTYFEQQADWDDEELAYMAGRQLSAA